MVVYKLAHDNSLIGFDENIVDPFENTQTDCLHQLVSKLELLLKIVTIECLETDAELHLRSYADNI